MDSLQELQASIKQRRLSRRAMLGTLGGGGAALAAGLALPAKESAAADVSDADILSFALNLEYLEAEFFTIATTGERIPDSATDGRGTRGPTTGGRKIPFEDRRVAAVAAELALDERAHVMFLRKALGRARIAKPAINLEALGIGFANDAEFLTLARAIEDVGVSAYAGAAHLIKNKVFLIAAARILADEAYHQGNVRFQLAAKGVAVPAVDVKDQPPTLRNFFPTDSNGLVPIRAAMEVAAIIRGPDPSGGVFFPNGLNGKIR